MCVCVCVYVCVCMCAYLFVWRKEGRSRQKKESGVVQYCSTLHIVTIRFNNGLGVGKSGRRYKMDCILEVEKERNFGILTV